MIGRLILLLPLVVLMGADWLPEYQSEVPVPLSSDRLVPGTGWNGETIAGVRPGTHADAVCVAEWTRVPDQILWRTDDEAFRLGVLAYHRSRIERVRFAVDGGPWLDVAEMKRSAQTGHYEFSAVLRPGDFTRGWHEVRAVAVPRAGADLGGTERVLTWSFYASHGEVAGIDFLERWVDPVAGSDANGDGSEASPFRTLRRAINSVASQPEGARILLRGNGSTPIPIGGQTVEIQNERPITIRRAPGQFPTLGPQSGPQADVLQVRNLRLEELKIDFSVNDLFDRGALAGTGRLTLANCDIRGYSIPADQALEFFSFTPGNGFEPVWMVGGRALDYRGVLRLEWGRDIEVSDAQGPVLVRALIDSEVRDTSVGFQGNLGIMAAENGLLDGVRILGAGSAVGPIEGAAADGTAIVNCLLDGRAGDLFYETIGFLLESRRHLLILHTTFADAHIQVNSTTSFPGPYDMEHGLVFGVVSEYFVDEGSSGFLNNTPSSPSGLDLDPDTIHTHHPGPAWSAWTAETQPQTFVDLSRGDFRIRAGSSASGRIAASEAHNRFDLDAARRGPLTALGALKAEGE